MWISTMIWHLIQNSKCGVQKKIKPEVAQVSGLNVQAPLLDDEGDEFSFCPRAATGSGLFCFPAGTRVFPLDNAQKFVVRGGVLHAEVLCGVLADAQLDRLCWRNCPQLYLFVLSRMCVSFAALILCGWSHFLCFFWVWGDFLSVSCQNFNISFSSVKFFSLGSWKLVNIDLPFQDLFLKLGIHYFSKPSTGCFLPDLSIASKV